MNDPGAPARTRIGIPSSRSRWFLRLTASAFSSAQKKQRLISTVTIDLRSAYGSAKQPSRAHRQDQERLVLRAIHSSRRKVQAKNGKIPYNVSLTE